MIPDYENKGIGQAAMRFIESEFPNATTWTLETPENKEKNHYFYKKAGYNIVKEEIELLEVDKSGIHVAQYLTQLPPKELFQEKLHKAIERAKNIFSAKTIRINIQQLHCWE